jgi:hypothetical protein
MADIVFNPEVELYGQQFIQKIAPIPQNSPSEEVVKQRLLALLFEQFLLFDKIAIKVERDNLSLYFLIRELGLNKVEELLEKDIIQLVLWTPVIASVTGYQEEVNGPIDYSAAIGRPPLIAGNFTESDSDPEKNIDTLLLKITGIHRDRKRIFKRKALKQYKLPEKNISSNAVSIVLDAYNNNRLSEFDLPFEKAAEELDSTQRAILLNLGAQILETTVLAEKKYKSYNKYNYYRLTDESIRHIRSALGVSKGTGEILKQETLPDIYSLFLQKKIPFDRAFELRNNKNIKEYRKWINAKSITVPQEEIVREYIDAIANKKGFFEEGKGKFVKTIGMYAFGEYISSLSNVLIPPTISGLGLTMFDSFILEGLIKGWNPRMFIDQVKKEIKQNEQ